MQLILGSNFYLIHLKYSIQTILYICQPSVLPVAQVLVSFLGCFPRQFARPLKIDLILSCTPFPVGIDLSEGLSKNTQLRLQSLKCWPEQIFNRSIVVQPC